MIAAHALVYLYPPPPHTTTTTTTPLLLPSFSRLQIVVLPNFVLLCSQYTRARSQVSAQPQPTPRGSFTNTQYLRTWESGAKWSRCQFGRHVLLGFQVKREVEVFVVVASSAHSEQAVQPEAVKHSCRPSISPLLGGRSFRPGCTRQTAKEKK